MEKVSMIGIDLAKNWFQLHGVAADGSVVFRKKLVRHKVLDFLASQPNCPVAMEACAGAHWWGRGIMELGHEVRLVPLAWMSFFAAETFSPESGGRPGFLPRFPAALMPSRVRSAINRRSK